jgi:hypothetical protein
LIPFPGKRGTRIIAKPLGDRDHLSTAAFEANPYNKSMLALSVSNPGRAPGPCPRIAVVPD